MMTDLGREEMVVILVLVMDGSRMVIVDCETVGGEIVVILKWSNIG